MRRLRPHLSFANVCSFLALIVALGTGGAYAANTIVSSDIINGEVKTADLAANAVNSSKIADGQVVGPDIGSGAVREDEIYQASVGTSELKTDAVTTQKVLNETLLGADVAANTLKGSDIDESTLSSIGGGGPAGGDLTGTYPNPEIRANRVGSAEVATESLTGADVRNQSGVDTCTHGTARIDELCFLAENTLNGWLEALNRCADLGLRLPTVGEALELAKTHDLPNVDDGEEFWTSAYFYQGDSAASFVVTDGGSVGTSVANALWETVCVTTPTN